VECGRGRPLIQKIIIGNSKSNNQIKNIMNKIITLSGTAGTGKTTIGNQLAAKLDYTFLSIGNYTREMAARMGLDINEFQKYAQTNPEIDQQIDREFIKVIHLNGNCIVDYRLGFHFCRTGYNVLLKVSDEEAAKRIQNRNNSSDGALANFEESLSHLRQRNRDMRDRLKSTYGKDFTDETNYHLVLDTTETSPEINLQSILEGYTLFVHDN
jgi:predicted cytidylate kinase